MGSANVSGALRQFADAIVVGRVPTLPAKTVVDVYSAPDPLAALRALIGSTPALQTGIRVASPSLYADMNDWLTQRPLKNKRVALSLLAYTLRMATRCTPFGLFTSIGCVELGSATSLELGPRAGRSLHVRPETAWTTHLVGRRLRDPEIADDALLFANDLTIDRGDRFYVYRSDRAQRIPVEPVPIWRYDGVCVSANPTLRFIRELCANGIPASELIGLFETRLGAAAASARGLIGNLLDAGLLVNQRPSLLADPLASSSGWIARHSDGPAVARLAGDLASIETLGVDALSTADISRLEAQMTRLSPTEKPALRFDVTHGFAGTLDAAILDDVALLAKIALAQAPPTDMSKEIERFVERYESIDRLVPLLELVQSDFAVETRRRDSARASASDRLLVELAAEAVRDGRREIELTPQLLDRLYPGLRDRALDQSCEIGFRVSARTRTDVARGAYRIVATKLASSNGTAKSARRFSQQLGQPFSERLAAAERQRTSDGDDIVAELEYLPLDVRYADLVTRMTGHRHIIADAATPCPAQTTKISPADILIGIEDGRFVAYSRSLARRLRIEDTFLLDADYFAPPHMRLLAQIAHQDRATPGGWNWGIAADLMPFWPRVCVDRIILAPATWLIPKHVLNGTSDALAATLADWRVRWNLPRWVVLTERDMQLPLDLDAPIAIDLLHDQLRRYGSETVKFEELLPAVDELWLSGEDGTYCHEFVASLIATPPKPRPPARKIGDLDLDGLRAGAQSSWAYVKLYVAATEIDTLILTQLASIVRPIVARGDADRWFFLRYRDPEPHVRLRLRSTGESGWDLVNALVAAIGPLMAAGVVRRFSFDTYLPEIERYGGAVALEAVETLFALDSEAAIGELAGAIADVPTRRIAALRSLTRTLPHWFGVLDVDAWLEKRAESSRSIRGIDYALVRSIGGWLAEIENGVANGASRPEIDAIERLAQLERSGNLTRPLEAIFESLVHMHFNRFGIAFEDETFLIAHVWRAVFGRGRERQAQFALAEG